MRARRPQHLTPSQDIGSTPKPSHACRHSSTAALGRLTTDATSRSSTGRARPGQKPLTLSTVHTLLLSLPCSPGRHLRAALPPTSLAQIDGTPRPSLCMSAPASRPSPHSTFSLSVCMPSSYACESDPYPFPGQVSVETVAGEFDSGGYCPKHEDAKYELVHTMSGRTPTRPSLHAAPSREEAQSPVTPASLLSSLSVLSLRRRRRSPSAPAPARNSSLSEPAPWSTTSSTAPPS
jgi:hypothetical protein